MQYLTNGTLLQGGKYKIVRFINSGGFGCTYEAYDTLMETRVAIKEFFVKDFCNRDEATSHVTLATQNKRELVGKLRQKFIEEARAIFKMKHDNIVRVNTFFEENGTAYYVMEYVDGLSLNDILKKRGSLSETEMLGYIRQVASALKYVHQQNRLHLDVKPGNILVDNTGKAVLIDFGASKHYDEGTGENTTTMQGLNTPGYAPYEQTVEGITEFTPASDIYALGATMYKLLTGETPPNSGLLFLKKKTLAPLPETISTVTRNAITAAMQLHEGNRPQSIDEFLEILEDNGVEGTGVDDTDEDNTIYEDDDITIKTEPISKQKPEPPTPKLPKPGTKPKTFNWKFLAGTTAVILIVLLMVVSALKGDSITNSNVGSTDSIAEGIDDIHITESDLTDHECVDLGLSVKWATMNIGANAPEEYGEYFAWGETNPKNDYFDYSWDTYFDSVNGSNTDFKKYAIGKKTTLDPEDDAAHVNWGGSWRIPTKEELDELREKCIWTWTTLNGEEGYDVTSKYNGNSIFLPAAHSDADIFGNYSSADLHTDSSSCAYILFFNSSGINWYDLYQYERARAHSVRPVCP